MPPMTRKVAKEYYAANRDKLIYQSWVRQIKLLGCSPEMYDELLKKQNGLCAICGGDNITKRRLAVDHCRKTRKIRGLLCQRCNTGLGLFLDNPMLLQSAIEYLLKAKEFKNAIRPSDA